MLLIRSSAKRSFSEAAFLGAIDVGYTGDSPTVVVVAVVVMVVVVVVVAEDCE